MEPGPHVEEMEAAIRADGEGLRALLDGDPERARRAARRGGRALPRLVGARAAAQLRPARRDAQGGGDRRRRGRGGRVRARAGRRGRLTAVLLRPRDRGAGRGRRRGGAGRRRRDARRARPRSAVPPTRSRRWRTATPRPTRPRCGRSSRTSRAARSTSPACPSPTPR